MSLPIVAWCALFAGAADGDAAFFEKKIRPVLVEQCYACHSVEAGKSRGGLKVDTRQALLSGGDSGTVLVPGQPGKSLLLDALRHDGDLKMPPKGKLSDAVIVDFERWIRDGAVDPRTERPIKPRPPKTDGRDFWSFRAPQRVAVPQPRDKDWGTNDIDAFILAGLEAKGLKPAQDAPAGVLVRRLHFDLIGLPPTPEEIDAFEKSARIDLGRAMEETADRLLRSPRFGERWGRHWLDIVRYGESLTLRGFVLKEAWRYRDYVIDSFNHDVPLDRFLKEQIAGDLMTAADPAERRRQIIAAGFLTLGNNNLEEQDVKLQRMDVIDEQLETLGKAFLGQSIGCARCHDHKFDPIPTRDYYALAGIFRNVRTLEANGNIARWLEVPLPSLTGNDEEIRKHEEAVALLKAEIDAAKAIVARAAAKSADPARPRVVPVGALVGIVVDDSQAMKVGEWKHSTYSGRYVGAGYVHDDAKNQGERTLTYQPTLPHSGMYEVRFAYSAASNRAPEVAIAVFSEDGEKIVKINEQTPPPIDGLFVSLGQYRFEKTGQTHVVVSNAGAKGHVVADAVVYIPVERLKDAAPQAADTKKSQDDVVAKEDRRLKELEAQMKKLQATGPKRDLALGMREEKKPENARIHFRGSVKNLGDEVPRGFLQVASLGPVPKIPDDESGRWQLAEWIASPNNPLTACVLVNRLWLWTFGEGLVRTPDNFGATGDRPTHPELLDALTLRFVDEGWSAKKLIRRLVLSRTYRQASSSPSSADPDNRLWGRADRRRMDAECIRDAILAVSGQLKLDTAGPSFAGLAADYNYVHKEPCRSVYVPVFRNALPDLFEAFDFADPSVTMGKRSTSTVAPQALFMLNNPFVLEQSKRAARRLLDRGDLDDDARLSLAYRVALGRPPHAAERRLAAAYLAEGDVAKRDETWARLVQTLFASIDFRYVH